MRDPGELIEALVRTVERLGSYTDAAIIPAIVRDLVHELGLDGAAVWEVRRDGLTPHSAEGASIDEAFARSALSEAREEDGRVAWPLRAGARTLGVLAIRGRISRPVVLLARMLAGRCAHILRDAQRAATQRALLEGLSHELRAPLQSLLGYIDVLAGGGLGPLSPDQAAALRSVAANAEKILAVARDVLQVARIDAGRETVIVGEVAVDELLEREVSDIRPLAEKAGLALELRCPAGLRLVSDGAKIARIVTNLLSNAVKYTAAGGITVAAEASGDGCCITVADTGRGIPEARLASVFEEYVRLEPHGDGTGLGLPIARRLATLLGGRLELASREGRGTTARLELPPCRGC